MTNCIVTMNMFWKQRDTPTRIKIQMEFETRSIDMGQSLIVLRHYVIASLRNSSEAYGKKVVCGRLEGEWFEDKILISKRSLSKRWEVGGMNRFEVSHLALSPSP